MRGENEKQLGLLSVINLEARVRKDHPLRRIKPWADRALGELSPVFAAMYSGIGRPSIPPERLLKSLLLMAFYSVRSDRLFCERMEYDLLFRWFLDMDVEESGFDASTFSKNRDRLMEHEVVGKFFAEVVALARAARLLDDEHFTVDGTLIEAWASAKSFRPKTDADQGSDDNFHGQQRRNDTHQSTTDGDSRLARKGPGKEARLSFGAHALMDSRHGLCADLSVTLATESEPKAAVSLLERQRRLDHKPFVVAADRGYHCRGLVDWCRQNLVTPHVATVRNRQVPGLDGRTLRTKAYRQSQHIRRGVERIFGWCKSVGGLRKTRYRGLARVTLHAQLVATAYNLLRIANLMPVPA
jgi:transposase